MTWSAYFDKPVLINVTPLFCTLTASSPNLNACRSEHLLNVVMATRKIVFVSDKLRSACFKGSKGGFCNASNTTFRSYSGSNFTEGGLELKTPFNGELYMGVAPQEYCLLVRALKTT